MRLGQTIPAMPVRDVAAAVACYRDRFGFSVVYGDTGFAVLTRDDAEVHLWQAGDASWERRTSLQDPVRSGAESFIAGTASFRVAVEDVDEPYDELQATGVLHYADRGAPVDTDYGTREFVATDIDNNLITFFRRVVPRR